MTTFTWSSPEQKFVTALDGRHIPADPRNSHYADILASGATIAAYVAPAATTADVNRERDRRLVLFPYGGKVYNFDEASQSNINGAFSIAMAAVMTGAEVGDLRWADSTYDFSWITSTNEIVPMDAHAVVAFGKAAAAWKSAHIFKARTLKDTNPIPSDYTADAFWPAS